MPYNSDVAEDREAKRLRWRLRALAAVGAGLLIVGFVWLWRSRVPAIYAGYFGITEAERLQSDHRYPVPRCWLASSRSAQ